MSRPLSLDDLWNSSLPATEVFEPGRIAHLPEPARRYLEHAIASGTSLASAVRLAMHGEIKVKGWQPFTAEQVISWNRGMIWKAAVRVQGLTIRGFDSLVEGQGAMQWKLFGIVPIVHASGLDVTRSAAGRVNIESVWLPSVLCSEQALWTAPEPSYPHARLAAHHETAELDYTIDPDGRLKSISMPRWGNPEGAQFHLSQFGGLIEDEGTFGGYTIPTRLRIGWYFGADQFKSEGEFFRATVDEAAYR